MSALGAAAPLVCRLSFHCYASDSLVGFRAPLSTMRLATATRSPFGGID